MSSATAAVTAPASLRARAVVDRRLREPAARGQRAEDAAGQVRGAEREQLAVGVRLVLIWAHDRSPGGDRLHERHQRDARGPPATAARSGRGRARPGCGRPDGTGPVSATSSSPAAPIAMPGADREQRARDARRPAFERQQQRDRRRPPAPRCGQLMSPRFGARERSFSKNESPLCSIPSTLPSWPTAISSPVPALKPASTGWRDEVGDEAQPQRAGGQEQRPAEHRQRRGRGQRAVRIAVGDGGDGRAGQSGERRGRADRERPRRADQRVRHHRHQRGVRARPGPASPAIVA